MSAALGFVLLVVGVRELERGERLVGAALIFCSILAYLNWVLDLLA